MSFGLGRSNSLSINTGAGGSLFGGNNAAASQGQQSAGLFGTAGANTGSSQPATGGLFGGAAAPATSQPASGGLFGGLNKPATSGNTSGSLFGGALGGASSTPAAPASGGLFGGLGGGQQAQQQQQQQKPSLFGSTTTQQTGTTSSLFGGLGATNTQANQPATTPSLFGSTTTQQPQQQTGSLFGGGMSTTANPGLQGANTSTQSGLQIKTLDSIRGTTRFNDLHPDIQKAIQDLDDQFHKKMDYGDQVTAALPKQDEKVHSLAPDVEYIENLLATVELGLDNDIQNIGRLKELIAHDDTERRLLDRVRTNLALPPTYHYGYRSAGTGAINISAPSASTPSKAAGATDDADDSSKPVDLVSYFSTRADDMKSILDLYQNHIREIEQHLRTMEAGTVEKAQQLAGGRSAVRDQKRELSEALRAIDSAIKDTATKVHKSRDAVIEQTLGRV